MLPCLVTSYLIFSSHVKSAVDIHNLAGDIARPRPHEKANKFGNFLRFAKTTQRYGSEKLFSELGGQLSRHFRFDQSRRNRIYGDAARRDFPGDGFGKSDDRSLG